MNLFKQLAVAAMIAGGVGAANATLVLPGPETSLQTIIQNLYTAGGSNPANAPDVNADQYGLDELWQIGGSGGSVTTFVIQISGLANQHNFGIYDASDSSKRVSLFSGSLVPGFPNQVTVSLLADGSVILNNVTDTGIDFAGNQFGYYLTAGNTTFFSQSGLNASGNDHMVAYQGTGDNIKIGNYAPGPWSQNEFIVAFEDAAGLGDQDYNDFVALVESVVGVPEPGTLGLVGLTLAGLGLVSRRRRAQ